MNKKHSPLKGLLILVGGLLYAGVALAASTQNAPGSACVATSGQALTARADGEAENQSASLITAICPTERPIGTGVTTTNLSGTVFVVDQNASTNVCCRAVSKNPGGTKTTGAWSCSTGSSASYQTLNVASITDAYSFSSFYLECQVPAISGANASRIQMYRAIQD
ncbi:hypothetical protein [Polyangium mundeleinium]|uniref:Ig-like domain-containing protein n=1 Tax=Polyangium mundeleinium TaxID=2995306 RepID=A0ABT5EML2_9BACT|nr:hypothetical protein [Polyangium mundeleinium]MDC0743075.1 hypothetical protein [Polyangium mundeleinium]